jgi:hypothetical protein
VINVTVDFFLSDHLCIKTNAMEYLGYFASIIIGISLGLIGGGGSILTIPILVYLFKVNPEQATSYSLFIVGLSAILGSYSHYKIGNLKLKSALYFAIPSVISILIIREVIFPQIASTLFSIASYFRFQRFSDYDYLFGIDDYSCYFDDSKKSTGDKRR